MNLKKIRIILTSVIFYIFTFPQSVMAGEIQSSKFFTGTQKLIEDATTALMVLAPIVGILMCIYYFIRKMTSDEMDAKKWSDRIKTAIICVIIAEGFSTLLKLIIGYFK